MLSWHLVGFTIIYTNLNNLRRTLYIVAGFFAKEKLEGVISEPDPGIIYPSTSHLYHSREQAAQLSASLGPRHSYGSQPHSETVLNLFSRLDSPAC